jgi:nucleotide-binding universal stress UspA family protein
MRVLLAYDSGPTGEKALTAAANWIRESGAELHLVHVVSPGAVHETPRSQRLVAVPPQSTVTGVRLNLEEPPAPLTEDRSQAYLSTKDRAEEEMRELARRHVGDYPVTPHAIVADETAAEIVGLATEIQADVIAVGTQRRGRLSHILLGSVAEAVVRNATVPVLVVGPGVV